MAVLAACGSTSGAGTTSAPLASNQTLVIANTGISEIASMDPATVTDLNSASAESMVFSGLVGLDAQTLDLKADMAQELPTVANGDITNNGTTYTFKLKPNLKFSNGDPVDASVMAYSIDRALNPKVNSPYATFYLGAIKGAADRFAGKVSTIIGAAGSGAGLVVVDPTTLQINLTSNIAYFLDALTYSTSFAVDPLQLTANPSSSQFTTKWTDQPVGTGPFMVQSWQHNVQITMVPNPNWYGQPTKLTKVVQVFVAEPNVAYSSYKTAQFDIDGFGGSAISSDNYQDAKSLPNGQLTQSPYLSIAYYSMNWNIAPWNNATVRRAFAEATDRDTINNVTLKGSAISSDHIVPQGMPGYYAGLKGVPFSPTQAAADLKSVYPDLTKFPTVTLDYPKTSDNDKIAAELQKEFTTYLGLTTNQVRINGEDFNTIVTAVQTFKEPFYILAWIADYPDAQDWLSGQFTSTSANNDQNARIPGFDAQAAKADTDQNQAERLSIYNTMEEEAVDSEAWVPYSQGKNLYVTQPWVHGFVISAGGLTPDDVWANVYITQH
jgi:peptide/nickel transport system substrate-binding protein/oligopeptide transport system substrate-binding protein